MIAMPRLSFIFYAGIPLNVPIANVNVLQPCLRVKVGVKHECLLFQSLILIYDTIRDLTFSFCDIETLLET